jgi:hypothetical protein
MNLITAGSLHDLSEQRLLYTTQDDVMEIVGLLEVATHLI